MNRAVFAPIPGGRPQVEVGVVSGRVLEPSMVVEEGRCVRLKCHCSADRERRDETEVERALHCSTTRNGGRHEEWLRKSASV